MSCDSTRVRESSGNTLFDPRGSAFTLHDLQFPAADEAARLHARRPGGRYQVDSTGPGQQPAEAASDQRAEKKAEEKPTRVKLPFCQFNGGGREAANRPDSFTLMLIHLKGL